MKKKYRLSFTLDAIIQESPLSGSAKDVEDNQKARKFIIEFAKNKDAVRAFFLNHCIEKYFHDFKNDYKEEFDLIVKKLGYTQDIGSLFVSAAKEFPEDVKKELLPFLEWTYEDVPKDHPDALAKDDTRFFIENFFSSMSVGAAEFSEVLDESVPQ